MPKSKSNSTVEQKKPSSVFVNYELTKEDKRELAGMPDNPKDLFSALTALVKEGYRLTIGWDDWAGCPAVWLIGHSEATKNHGLILPSRASDLQKALLAVLYKHHTVFEGIWHSRLGDGKPTDDF